MINQQASQKQQEILLLASNIGMDKTLSILKEVSQRKKVQLSKIELLPTPIRVKLVKWVMEGGRTQKDMLALLNQAIIDYGLDDTAIISRPAFNNYMLRIRAIQLAMKYQN